MPCTDGGPRDNSPSHPCPLSPPHQDPPSPDSSSWSLSPISQPTSPSQQDPEKGPEEWCSSILLLWRAFFAFPSGTWQCRSIRNLYHYAKAVGQQLMPMVCTWVLHLLPQQLQKVTVWVALLKQALYHVKTSPSTPAKAFSQLMLLHSICSCFQHHYVFGHGNAVEAESQASGAETESPASLLLGCTIPEASLPEFLAFRNRHAAVYCLPSTLLRLHRLGQRTGLWRLDCVGLVPAVLEKNTRFVWRALLAYPRMDGTLWGSFRYYTSVLERQTVLRARLFDEAYLRHAFGVASPAAALNGGGGGGAEEELQQQLPYSLRRRPQRRRQRSAPFHEEEKREEAVPSSVDMLQDPRYFPPVQPSQTSPARPIHALPEPALLSQEQVDMAAPEWQRLGDLFTDPITQDLIQVCPVLVRLRDGTLSSKVYERETLQSWVDVEHQRQQQQGTTSIIIREPCRDGDIDLSHPHGWAVQPHFLWHQFRVFVAAVKASAMNKRRRIEVHVSSTAQANVIDLTLEN